MDFARAESWNSRARQQQSCVNDRRVLSEPRAVARGASTQLESMIRSLPLPVLTPNSTPRRANQSGLMYHRPSQIIFHSFAEVDSQNAGKERRGHRAGKR